MGIFRRPHSLRASYLVCFVEDIWEMFGFDEPSLSNVHTILFYDCLNAFLWQMLFVLIIIKIIHLQFKIFKEEEEGK